MTLLELSPCEENSFISSRQQHVLIKILLSGHFRDMYSFHIPYSQRHLYTSIKFQCDIITNQHERSPVLYFTKLVRFSHMFHGFVQ